MIIDRINKKEQENVRLSKLQDYYAGKQNILLRHYDDPTKPNNKIVINYCQKIADFLTSYLTGVPIEYTNIDEKVSKALVYNDTDETTQNSVLNMNICGVGYELLYIDELGEARFKAIDPKEMIIVYDDTLDENIVKAIRYYPVTDTEGKIDHYNVAEYDSKYITTYTLNESISTLTKIDKTEHHFNDVPVVVYRNNELKQGSFEQVLALQDAYNKLCSDEVNDFESFVDAYLALEGMDGTNSEDIARMKEDRVLLIPQGAKASWLIKDVNNEHNKDLKEKLEEQIREIGCIPKLDESFGTSSGVAIRYKLIPTEIKATEQERNVYKAIQRRLELLYGFLKPTASLNEFALVNIKFVRNFIVDEERTANIERLRNDALSFGIDEVTVQYFMKAYGFTDKEARRLVENIPSNDDGTELEE